MITLRKSTDRGHADHGWLKSFHSFSFADYMDPKHMGVGNLRVINEDRIAPGTGFGTHGHRDMEIVSYVLSGVLGHKDSLGNGAQIVPGDVQRMSAGRGIRHSEFNQAPQSETHFLQIWLLPDERDIEPGYEQKHFEEADKRGRLRLVASRDAREGSITIHANASMYAGLFDGGEAAELPLDTTRVAYVHLVRGRIEVNGQVLDAGDAMTLRGEERLMLANGQAAEVIVFDLAA
ncbi:pirin family protein [Rhizobacter sp. Root1221]|uniref:pirin family protein n=1 Tax=Rhizobacter sp. Root1221 TaxID=1736433 RepID=UPI000700120D|nr:pirin family protein [Rhizobacter sp. Root1221]KQV97242.1 quercetin 2,3-dioxygenase [Rhizobacter sp. Root1221]